MGGKGGVEGNIGTVEVYREVDHERPLRRYGGGRIGMF